MSWQLLLSYLITIPALVIAAFLLGFILYSRIKRKEPRYRAPGCKGTEKCCCFSCELMREVKRRAG